jgi:hypothetical protein
MQSFINQVLAQFGKQITTAQAAELTAAANAIPESLD